MLKLYLIFFFRFMAYERQILPHVKLSEVSGFHDTETVLNFFFKYSCRSKSFFINELNADEK